ncbi:MAG: DUF2855 family protein [Ilumatobacteraceae bacterium]
MHFEVERREIRHSRWAPTVAPVELAAGDVLLTLERAALTSNNVSYALSGDMLDYWGFFPTEPAWGRLPVMGFGVVTKSAHPEVAVGGRYFGFFPLADHHVVAARSTAGGFSDAALWREKHAAAYRNFDLAQPTPHDDALLIFRGLFITSFLLEDFLREHHHFGAEQVVVLSASSKTAIALAHCLRRSSKMNVVGLTSTRNISFTDSLAEYHQVLSYDQIAALDARPAIVVDMSGNMQMLAQVYAALGANIKHCASVGATHWDAPRHGVTLPDPRPQFFFAPSQLSKRGKELGREVLNRRITEALDVFVASTDAWLQIQRSVGSAAIGELYGALVRGDTQPNEGNIISFS